MEKTTGGRNGTKEDVLDGRQVLSKEEERMAESCPWPIPSIGSHKARRRKKITAADILAKNHSKYNH